MGTERISITAANNTYVRQIQSNRFTAVSFSKPVGGTAVTGTATLRFRVPGAIDFETIAGISPIDLAPGSSVTEIVKDRPVSEIEIVLTLFTGAASDLEFAINTYDFRV